MGTPILEALIEGLEESAAIRRSLGGYNADAPSILFLHNSLLVLTQEVLQLRKEVWKMKTAPKKRKS